MTRDEQAAALKEWWHDQYCQDGVAYNWITDAITDHFPAFMEKCAEVGLCEMQWNSPPDGEWFLVRKPKPPHAHEWRVSEIGRRPWSSPDEPTLRIVCECGTRRDVPNLLPIEPSS